MERIMSKHWTFLSLVSGDIGFSFLSNVALVHNLLFYQICAFQEVKSRKQKEKKVPNRSSNDAAESCSQFPGGAPTCTRGREFGIHISTSFPQARTFQVAKNKQLKIQEMRKSSIKAAAESGSRCPPSTSTLASHMPQTLRTQTSSSLPLEPLSVYASAENCFPCYSCSEFNPFRMKRDLKEHNRKDHYHWKEKCRLCYNVFLSNKKLLDNQEALSH
ncbi:hypothetical protein FRX31_017525, partial [Thalictrum thalictroides]